MPTSEGKFKIDESLKYLCSLGGGQFSCPSTHSCLSDTDAVLRAVGVDSSDSISGLLRFHNIYQTIIYIVQIQSFDDWVDTFMLLKSSDTQLLLVLAVFGLSSMSAIIMQGLIISNYCSNLSIIKNKEVGSPHQIFLKDQFKAIEGLTVSLAAYMKAVGPTDQNLPKFEKKRSCREKLRDWLLDLFSPMEQVFADD